MANIKAYFLKVEPDPSATANPFISVQRQSYHWACFQESQNGDTCIFGAKWGHNMDKLRGTGRKIWVIEGGDDGPDQIFQVSNAVGLGQEDWGKKRDCRYGFDQIVVALTKGVETADIIALLQKRNLDFKVQDNTISILLNGSYANSTEAYKGDIDRPTYLMDDVMKERYPLWLDYTRILDLGYPFKTFFPSFAGHLLSVLAYFAENLELHWQGRCTFLMEHKYEGFFLHSADYWDNCVDPPYFKAFQKGENLWTDEWTHFRGQSNYGPRTEEEEFCDNVKSEIQSNEPIIGEALTDRFIMVLYAFCYLYLPEKWERLDEITNFAHAVKNGQFDEDYLRNYLAQMFEDSLRA